MRDVSVRPARAALSQRQRCLRVASRSRDVHDGAATLGAESLLEYGYTRDEAEAERAWDPLDTDPLSEIVSFDDLYSVHDDLPDDLRAQLSQPCYGPPAILVAGFVPEEYAMIRYLLDSVNAQHVKVLPCDDAKLHSPLGQAMLSPEVDWARPRPKDFMMGTGWGSQRVCLFCGLSVAQQATVVELLESHGGMDRVATCSAHEEQEGVVLGELFAQAVKAFRQQRSGSHGKPSWARDVQAEHVADGKLPDIHETLKDVVQSRVQEMQDAIDSVDVVEKDLPLDATVADRDQLSDFLQGIVPPEAMDEYLSSNDHDEAPEREGVVADASEDTHDASIGEAFAASQRVTEPDAQSSDEQVSSAAQQDRGAFTPAEAVTTTSEKRAEGTALSVKEYSRERGPSLSARASEVSGRMEAAVPAEPVQSRTATTQRTEHEPEPGQDLIDAVVSGRQDVQLGYDDRWLSTGAAPEQSAAPGPTGSSERVGQAPADGVANERGAFGDESDNEMLKRAASDADAMSDAITRAIKSGVDRETLKRYIDEIADNLAGQEGSWVADADPERARAEREAEELQASIRGSMGSPLTYGPPRPPLSDWDMKEEVRAERSARQQAASSSVQSEAAAKLDHKGDFPSQISGSLSQRDVRLQADSPYPTRQGMGHIPKPDLVSRNEEDHGDLVAEPSSVSEAASSQEEALSQGIRLEGFEDEKQFTSASRASASKHDDAPRHVDFDTDVSETAPQSKVVSLQDLRATAERHGLDLDVLLQDARAKGVVIE